MGNGFILVLVVFQSVLSCILYSEKIRIEQKFEKLESMLNKISTASSVNAELASSKAEALLKALTEVEPNKVILSPKIILNDDIALKALEYGFYLIGGLIVLYVGYSIVGSVSSSVGDSGMAQFVSSLDRTFKSAANGVNGTLNYLEGKPILVDEAINSNFSFYNYCSSTIKYVCSFFLPKNSVSADTGSSVLNNNLIQESVKMIPDTGSTISTISDFSANVVSEVVIKEITVSGSPYQLVTGTVDAFVKMHLEQIICTSERGSLDEIVEFIMFPAADLQTGFVPGVGSAITEEEIDTLLSVLF